MADVTLRFATQALNREDLIIKDPNLLTLWKVLDQAAQVNQTQQPLWFAYLEAALHMSERMLGAQLSKVPGQKPCIAIETPRLRGKPCGAYSTPHFIVHAVLSDIFATNNGSKRLNMLDLSVEGGHFPISVVAHTPPDAEINFYAVDRDPIAIRLTNKLFSFAAEHSRSEAKELFSTCRDSLLDVLPSEWPSSFDVVLGNPPWAGSKNSYNRTIKDAFAPWLSHNFDLYLAFILRASQYVKPGGTLAFVVPSTLLFNDSAVRIREHLLENYDVISMRLFPRRSFIEVPCLIPIAMVLVKKNGAQSTKKKKTLIEYHPHPLGGRLRPRTTSLSFAPEIWRKDPMKSFHPIVGPQYSAYLRHFASLPRLSEQGLVLSPAKFETNNTVPLKSPFRGFHARDVRIFHACGRNCHLYEINAQYFAAPPDPAHLRARKVVFQNFRYMTHERRLVAAAIGPDEYGVSTAAQFIPHLGGLTDFYAALLNSSIVNSWFKLADVSRSIKVALVRNIPVALDSDLVREIGEIAAQTRKALSSLHDQLDQCPNSTREDQHRGRDHDVFLEFRHNLDRMEALFVDLYKLSDKQKRMATTLSTTRVF
jgi:hypothetical protein